MSTYELISLIFNDSGVLAKLRKTIDAAGTKKVIAFAIRKTEDIWHPLDAVLVDGVVSDVSPESLELMSCLTSPVVVKDELREQAAAHFTLAPAVRNLHWDNKWLRYITLQRNYKEFNTQTLQMSIGNAQRDIALIDRLATRPIRSVLDIGCGLGIFDLALDMFYQNKNGTRPVFYMFDRTTKKREERKVFYGFNKEGTAFYNNMEYGHEFMEANGVPGSNLHYVNTSADKVLSNKILVDNVPQVDLIVSIISWGFHYDVSYYLDSVCQVLADDGLVCFHVRSLKESLPVIKSCLQVLSPSAADMKEGSFFICKKTI